MFFNPRPKIDTKELGLLIQRLGEGATKIQNQNAFLEKLLNIGIIYVTDINTNTIVWVNQNAKDAFGDDIIGQSCHKTFQNLDQPCPFCTNSIIKSQPNKPYQWVFHNDKLNKTFFITDIYFRHQFNGHESDLRMEQAIEITDTIKRAISDAK